MSLIDPFRPCPIHAMFPFGDPADFVSPVALRPRLATGVPFREKCGEQCSESPLGGLYISDFAGGYSAFVLQLLLPI